MLVIGLIVEAAAGVVVARRVAERDVARLLLDADADELKDTRNAQLTTFVSSLVVLDAAERLGLEPSVCAGHSLGEYTALTATGALGFDDGVRLVCERAAAMHDAGSANPGTMAAVLGLVVNIAGFFILRGGDRDYAASLPPVPAMTQFTVATGHSPFTRLMKSSLDEVLESVYLNYDPIAETTS